jgi:hypothetical protein
MVGIVMATDEIETVLTNWIEQAPSHIGQLAEGVTPADWVAARFSARWRERAGDTIGGSERAAKAVCEELFGAAQSAA